MDAHVGFWVSPARLQFLFVLKFTLSVINSNAKILRSTDQNIYLRVKLRSVSLTTV